MERPQGVAVDAQGNVWVTDRINNRIVAYDKSGAFLRQFGTLGTADGQIKEPRGIAIGPNGNVWVAEVGNKRIQQFTPTGTFVSKITRQEFSEPWGVAVGTDGKVWVTDAGGQRVFQFKGDGTFLKSKATNQFIQGGGAPFGIDLDASGNGWIALQGTHRVAKVNPELNAVTSFGSEGTGPGQFRHPIDIAVADSGNILVTDDLNARVQVFMPDGSFLRQFGTAGTANGQFSEPRGVDVGTGNSAVIADAGNSRVARWAHADQDPQSGTAKVEIKVDGASKTTKAPGCTTKNCAVSGSWTLDADDYAGGAHKVEVIATDAVGIQTTNTIDIETHGDGTNPALALSGTMTQQASQGTTRPSYKLKAVATDPGPAGEKQSGVASTVIKVDGTTVDSSSHGCPAGGCSITREWTLNSDSYSAGPHTVEVKATDAAGRFTAKTVQIEIARDTTAPTFNILAPFYTAPSGWLEQKSFDPWAYVLDNGGYGVTSVQLKIDGEVVQGWSEACPAGSCTKLFGSGQPINLESYSGGAHPAELIATDGAGNTRKRTWTMNVDPEGHITVAEAEATLEAADTTRDSSVVAATAELLDPLQIEGGDNPGLQLESGGDVASTGVPNTTTMTTNPDDGFTLHSPGGEVTITPGVGQNASSLSIAEGVAGVAANTATEVDSVIRPQYNGALTFQHIRSSDSPNEFSWHVDLAEGQLLRLANPTQAEVLYQSGHLAYLITSQGAHDAVGTEVPTSLSVSGNTLSLSVDLHSDSFVYPIISGQGWEGGYIPPVLIQGPEDELEIVEREKVESEAEESIPPPPSSGYFTETEAERLVASRTVADEVIPAPEPAQASGGATASSIPEKVVKPFRICAKMSCGYWWAEIRNPFYHYKRNMNGRMTSYWQSGTEVHSEWWYPWYYWPELTNSGCGVGFTGSNQVWAGEQKHLTVWARFKIVATAFLYSGDYLDFENNLGLQIWVWPNGFQQRVTTHWEETPEWIEQAIKNGEGCHE